MAQGPYGGGGMAGGTGRFAQQGGPRGFAPQGAPPAAPAPKKKGKAAFPPLKGKRGIFDFQVSIANQEEFLCMPPNFLGLDDSSKSDCVMWKGSRVHYTVKCTSGGGAEVHIELE